MTTLHLATPESNDEYANDFYPSAYSDDELAERIRENEAQIVDITLQLDDDLAEGEVKGRLWRNKAGTARRWARQRQFALRAEQDNRTKAAREAAAAARTAVIAANTQRNLDLTNAKLALEQTRLEATKAAQAVKVERQRIYSDKEFRRARALIRAAEMLLDAEQVRALWAYACTVDAEAFG
jgi:hypothetical protein